MVVCRHVGAARSRSCPGTCRSSARSAIGLVRILLPDGTASRRSRCTAGSSRSSNDHVIVLSDVAELDGADRRRPRAEARQGGGRGAPSPATPRTKTRRRRWPAPRPASRSPPSSESPPDPTPDRGALAPRHYPAADASGPAAARRVGRGRLVPAVVLPVVAPASCRARRTSTASAERSRPVPRGSARGSTCSTTRRACSPNGNPPPVTAATRRRHGPPRRAHAVPAGGESRRRRHPTSSPTSAAAGDPDARADDGTEGRGVVPAGSPTSRRHAHDRRRSSRSAAAPRLRRRRARPRGHAGLCPTSPPATPTPSTSARSTPEAARHEAALGAIVYPAVQTDVLNPVLWPNFPYKQLAESIDVWMPMAYFTFRSDPLPRPVPLHRGERRPAAQAARRRQRARAPDRRDRRPDVARGLRRVPAGGQEHQGDRVLGVRLQHDVVERVDVPARRGLPVRAAGLTLSQLGRPVALFEQVTDVREERRRGR